MATTEDQVDADAGPDLAGSELEVAEPPVEGDGAGLSHEQDIERRIGQGKRTKKRVRKMLVSLHRWVSFVVLAWVVIISLTGAWLVFGDKFDSLFHSEWYHRSPGDVGPAAAIAAVSEELPDLKDGAYVYYEVMPTNGRGVYQVSVAEPQDAGGLVERYFNYYVDPGTGEVNGMRDEEKGFTHWMYRGHEYMWQDHGIFGVFTPGTGWCAPNADGAEPGGAKGGVCDVIPDGLDMIAWFGGGLFFILISGFYIWYWPNVRRWATALLIKRRRGRFQFHLSLHNAVGLVAIVPARIHWTPTGFARHSLRRSPTARSSRSWVRRPKRPAPGRRGWIAASPSGPERVRAATCTWLSISTRGRSWPMPHPRTATLLTSCGTMRRSRYTPATSSARRHASSGSSSG